MITIGDFFKVELKVVVNLEPRMMMGFESCGMMLAADDKEGPIFLTVPAKVPPGTKIR